LPLIAFAYAAYAGGLIAGFSGAAWIAVALSAAVALFSLFRRDTKSFALGLLFAAGAVVATTSPPPDRIKSAEIRASAEQNPGFFERTRLRAGRAIDRDFGSDAPLARALLIADRSQLDSGIRDQFIAAGLVHMLAISGLHVAVIAGAMQLVFIVVGAPARVCGRTVEAS